MRFDGWIRQDEDDDDDGNDDMASGGKLCKFIGSAEGLKRKIAGNRVIAGPENCLKFKNTEYSVKSKKKTRMVYKISYFYNNLKFS